MEESGPKKGFGFLKKKLAIENTESSNADVKSLKSSNINIKDEESYVTNKIMNDSLSSVPNINSRKLPFSERRDSNKSIQDLSPEGIKSRLKEGIEKSAENVKNLIINFNLTRKKLILQSQRDEEFHRELESLEAQEEEAIKDNNFEVAQNIENEITEIKANIEKVKEDIKLHKEEITTFREQELLIIRKKLRIFEETNNYFGKLKSGKEFELETFVNSDMNKHKNEKIKITKLKEKLDFLKTNLESDKSFIDDEEEKITKVIKSQSSGVFDELDELNINKNKILEEIEDIRKLLELKYSELDVINKAIETKEVEIDAIKSNFNHEFNKLNYKKKNYEESLNDYLEQENLYHKMVSVYESDEVKFEEKYKSIKNFVSELGNEISNFKTKMNILNEDLNKKEYLLKTENEILSKIYLIDMKFEKTNKNKLKNEEEIQKLELGIKKYEAEILGWDMKIPSLEEEKKGFVVLKNFKEAGRVSNELKSILESRNKNLNSKEENKTRINEIKTENESIEEELERINESRFIEEKELNYTKYEYLLLYNDVLNVLLEESGKLSNEKSISILESESQLIAEEKTNLESLHYISEKYPQNKDVKIDLQTKNESDVTSEDERIEQSQSEENKENDEKEIEESEDKKEIEAVEEEAIDLNKEEEEIDPLMINEKIQILNDQIQALIEEEDFENAEIIQNEIDLLNKKLIK